MFSYIRIFSLISLFLIIWAAYFVGLYYKHIASADLVSLVKLNSQAISQGYINTTWDKHRSTLLRLSRIDVNKWTRYREFQAFRRATIDYFDQMPVNEVRLYRKNGAFILSSNHGVDEESAKQELDEELFNTAISGHDDARILENHRFFLPNGEAKEGTIVSAYFPIFSKGYAKVLADQKGQHIEAVMRVDYDIGEEWQKLTNFQYIATGGIISIFMLLITLLIFFSRRAESIITKQHEINLELTAAAAAAESENRDKSMFLANISHELRTPLNAIIGFSDILSADLGPSLQEQHREYLRDINTSGKHLLSLINDILEFSKAEAGKLEVDLAEVDGVKMIKNSIRLMIPRADEAQVTLLEDVPKSDFVLHTDAKKLKQVLLNLLSNSVKFTPANGQIKVTAWHDVVRDRAVFVVSDTGIGIAPKDISKVMTPFGQVDSQLSRRYEGTGLGLPLSKKLVEILGGTFQIDSEEGNGTTITIDLPMSLQRENVGS